ncbi:MAG: hypothetical protein ACYC5O_00335 [Anaerolineae bacterium]
MNNREPVPTDDELLRAIAHFLSPVEPMSDDEADAILLENGLDPEAVGARMKAAADAALARSPYNWRTQARQQLNVARAAREGAKRRLKLNRQELLDSIQQLLLAGGREQRVAHAYYRNLTEATDEDLESLLMDLESLSPGQVEEAGSKPEE